MFRVASSLGFIVQPVFTSVGHDGQIYSVWLLYILLYFFCVCALYGPGCASLSRSDKVVWGCDGYSQHRKVQLTGGGAPLFTPLVSRSSLCGSRMSPRHACLIHWNAGDRYGCHFILHCHMGECRHCTTPPGGRYCPP